MKKIACIIAIFLLHFSGATYAQDKEISKIQDDLGWRLSEDFKVKVFKDSIALYTFAIKVYMGKKENKFFVRSIESNDSVCYRIFPKIDSILKATDFSIFIKEGRENENIIIPFAVIFANYGNMPPNQKIPVSDLYERLSRMFFYEKKHPDTHEYIFIPPIIILTGLYF